MDDFWKWLRREWEQIIFANGGWGIKSVQAWTNISIDNTDPNNPIISSTWGGGGWWWTRWSIAWTLSAQTDLQTALDGKSNVWHTHTIADVTWLQTELDYINTQKSNAIIFEDDWTVIADPYTNPTDYADKIDFTGAWVTATYDNTTNRITVDIPQNLFIQDTTPTVTVPSLWIDTTWWNYSFNLVTP
jgi:hypothetical protein